MNDLAASEKLSQELNPMVRKMTLVNIYILRAKMYALPFSSVFDIDKALKSLMEVRNLGWNNWFVDELEADLAFRNGEWNKAARLYLNVIDAIESEGWLRGAASCHLRIGESYLELLDFKEAENELNQAYKFFKKWGPPDQLAKTVLGLARLKSGYGEHDTAWELALEALDGVESLIRHFRLLFDQQRFLIDKLHYYDHAFDIGLAKGGSNGCGRAWTIAERAKSFYLCQLVSNADIPFFEGVDSIKLKELENLEHQLDIKDQELNRLTIEEKKGPKAGELEDHIRSISEKRQELINELMQDNPRWGALKAPPEFNLNLELDKLGDSWFPISYFWREKNEKTNLFIFYSGKDRNTQCTVVPWEKQEIALLDQYREQLQGKHVDLNSIVYPKDLVEKTLPKKIRDMIEAGQHLLISPHGGLHNIPFQVIDAGAEDYIINSWSLQYIPTFALLPLRRTDPHPDKILLMGCPENDFGDPILKDVYNEIDELYNIWSARRPDRVKKSIISAKSSPKEEGLPMETWFDFDILQFACHGEFPEGRPFDASLRLGTDAIRASELFRIRLRAKLVCLSACYLGRSIGYKTNNLSKIEEYKFSGDEWVGLYIPLFYSGAENLLVSLWEANSKVTAMFMKTLHGTLSEGISLPQAFQQAMKSVKHKPTAFWANWYFVGLPEYK
jgi:CHAT domain-containing protein